MEKLACVALVVVFAAGCASAPDKIGATYTSPLQYQAYDCQQIAAELARVNSRISELEGRLKKRADDDGAKAFVGAVLFWPILFALDGNGPEAQEYARLKGEREALEKMAIQNGCLRAPVQRR